MDRARNQGFDALRGMAAVGVVVSHFTSTFFAIYPEHTDLWPGLLRINIGHQSVLLFFVLSGFLIPISLDRYTSWKKFLFYRCSRIYPAFWACVVITFLVTTLIPLSGRETEWWEAAINLTMGNQVIGVEAVEVVYWSLYMEMYFYCWALLTYCRSRFFALKLNQILLFLASLSILNELTGVISNLPMLSYRLTNFLMLDYAHYFLAGSTIYNLQSSHDKRYCWFFVPVAAVILAKFGLQFRSLESVLAIVIVGCIARFDPRFFQLKPLRFLGWISYPYYLVHANVGYTIILICLQNGMSFAWALVIAFAATILIATAVSKFVEYPSMGYFRNLWKRRFEASG